MQFHKTSTVMIVILASFFLMGCGVSTKFEGVKASSSVSPGIPQPPPYSPPPTGSSAPSQADCTTAQYRLYTTVNASAPTNYYFGIYQVWGGTMDIYIPYSQAVGSVNLYLQAYSSTRWNIIGNVDAVRSVNTTGYESAYVFGVPSYKVGISTYAQNGAHYIGYTNGTGGVAYRKFQQVYEGYCVAPFTAD
jgi:hypothetical protein